MNVPIDRRDFLTAAGSVAAIAAGCRPADRARRTDERVQRPADTAPLTTERVQPATPNAEWIGWSLCCQLYTFRRFAFYDAIDIVAALGVRYVEPCFFLRLDRNRPNLQTSEELSAPLRKEMKQRLSDRGMKMINYYADLGKDEAAVRRTFEFAKQMEAETVVFDSGPSAEAFDVIERLSDEYTINLAMHNEPQPPTSEYWRPENVLAVCEGRGERIGACCDTGHWVRSGLNPVECLKKLEGRIITVHLKDVAERAKVQARDVPLGTGVGDCTAVLTELRRQGFRGVVSIEYEHDSPKLMDELAECLAFVEKTARSLAGESD